MFRHLLLAALITGSASATVFAQALAPQLLQQPGETVATDEAVVTDILEAALRFYKPFGSQSRWLDLQMLPASSGSGVTTLPTATAEMLIDRLGRGRFCTSTDRQVCRYRQGGRLRVSAPYLITNAQARVVVQFESVWPHGPSIVSYQVLWLGRDGRAWRILRRAGHQ